MLIAIVLVAAASIAAPASAGRLLGLFPHMGKSHFMVFEPLLRRMAERGHDVTVVSAFPLDNPPTGYHDISLVGMADIRVDAIDMTLFDSNVLGIRKLNHIPDMLYILNVGVEVCEKFVNWPAVQKLFTEEMEFDAVLVENFNSDCMLGVAQRFGVPIIAMLSHQLMPWSFNRMGTPENPTYIPALCEDLGQHMTFLERLENTLVVYGYQLVFRYYVQQREQAILEKRFGHKIPDLEDIARNYSLMLVNTHHSLNGIIPLVPGVIEVGGMHLKPKHDPLTPVLRKFVDEAEHGVIVFSFGSTVRAATMAKPKVDAFMRAFASIPQRVIWKWEEDDIPGRAENVMMMKWLPQYDLLHHPNVVAFIAHGGLLGMTEAAHAGVPMLVVPLYGDQPGNARAAQNAGLGDILIYTEISTESVIKGLKKVLNPEMRRSAQKLKEVWRDRPMAPLDSAIYWTERVLRHGSGGSGSLASPARRLPFYQRTQLDVAAVILLSLINILATIYFITKSVISFFRRLCCRKRKDKEH